MAAEKDKKTMDVSKPGKTAPDASARPIVVSHKPTVQDPMVKAEETLTAETTPTPEPVEAKTAADETSMTHSGNKVIQPLTDQPDEQPKNGEPVKSDEPATEKSEPETADEKEAKKEEAIVDAVAEQGDLGTKNDQMDQEELKRREAAAKLVAEKKYFVPVGQVARRRNRRTVVVLIVLVLLLAGAYLAADAGVVDAPFDLPVDLIQN